MKVAITGHSSGLGKALFELFDNAVGFDLTNGYDIQQPDKIVMESSDCDVFINNAYYKFCQVDLLEQLFKEWQYQNKIIVNISSIAPNVLAPVDTFGLYPTHKLALDDACYRLQLFKKNCKIINIKPGWIDTAMSKDFDVDNKLDPLYLAQEIKEVILSKNNFTTITIDRRI